MRSRIAVAPGGRLALSLTCAVTLSFAPAFATDENPDNSVVIQTPLGESGIPNSGDVALLGRQIVNPFNLNLMMSFEVPVTPRYPVNADINMGLIRFYNANMRSYAKTDTGRSTQRIRRTNPMGFGWEFTLGRIVKDIAWEKTPPAGRPLYRTEPWVFLGPDGSRTFLIPTPENADVYTSRDGSHLRARKYRQGGSQTIVKWELEYSGGTVLTFEHEVTRVAFNDVGFGSSDMDYVSDPEDLEDGPGTYLDRDYVGWYVTSARIKKATDTAPSYTAIYHPYPHEYILAGVTDRWGRQVDIAVGNGLPAGDVRNGAITAVSFPGPGGTVQQQTFEYEWMELEITVGNYPDPIDQNPPSQYEQQRVRALRRATDPLGFSDEYTYRPDESVEILYAQGTDLLGGQIEMVRYPSGKLEKFTYTGYVYDAYYFSDCMGVVDEQRNTAVGITKKEVFLSGFDGPQADETWTFTVGSNLIFDEIDDDCPAGTDAGYRETHLYEAVIRQIDPAGNLRRRYYSLGQPAVGVLGTEGSLIVDEVFEGSLPTADKIRRRTESTAPADPSQCEPGHHLSASNQVDTGVGYARLGLSDCVVTTETTTFHDSAGNLQATLVRTSTDLDGFHHPQRVEESGSALGFTRVTMADYASDNVDAGENACNALRANWLGEVMASWRVYVNTENPGNLRALTTFGYDEQTGLVHTVVRQANLIPPDACEDEPAPPGETVPPGSEGDVVKRVVYDNLGQIRSITLAERDGTSSYTTDYAWDFGMLTSVQRVGTGFYDTVRVNDDLAGLPHHEYVLAEDALGTNGVHTEIRYDALRRPVFLQTGNDEPKNWTYETEVMADGWLRLAAVRALQGDIESREVVDTAGRVKDVETIHTDGRATSIVKRTYNAMGWMETESQPCTAAQHAAQTCGLTTFSYADPVTGLLDPEGRPRRVVSPSGDETLFDYDGLAKKETRKNVVVRLPGGASVTRDVAILAYSDARGNLRLLDTDAGDTSDPARGADAIYEYDVLQRMTKANLVPQLVLAPNPANAFATSNGDGQIRTFTFDSLGRLVAETHPEKGLTETLDFDAAGTPLITRDARGAAWGYRFETELDGLGRPVRLWKVREGLAADDLRARYTFDSGLEGWTTGAGSQWRHLSAYNCAPAWTFAGGGSLYFGDPATCDYRSAAAGADEIQSPTIAGADAETLVQFHERRDVREGANPALDQVYLDVVDVGAGTSVRIFYRNATHSSWNAWQTGYAVRLGDYLDFPGSSSTKTIRLRFGFLKGDVQASGLGKGWWVDEVVVLRRHRQLLTETTYDADPCAGPLGDLCTAPPGWPAVVPKHVGRVTSRAHYAPEVLVGASIANRLLWRQTNLYGDASGRLTGLQTELDWDLNGTWHTFVTKDRYNGQGLLANRRYPRQSGEDAETYGYTYQEGLLREVDDAGGVSYLAGVTYTAANLPERQDYGNGTANLLAYDEENRIASLRSQRSTEPAFFATGAYAYQADQIVGMGPDTFGYDSTGRLLAAHVHGYTVGYTFDPYGNLTSRWLVPDAGRPPIPGTVFTGRTYTAAGQVFPDNRIHDAGYVYDPNGSLLVAAAQNGVVGTVHDFDALDRLTKSFWNDAAGSPAGVYLYDAAGLRVLRRDLAGGDEVVVTVRDAGGQALSEYRPRPEWLVLDRSKDYVHAGAGRSRRARGAVRTRCCRIRGRTSRWSGSRRRSTSRRWGISW